MVGGDLGDLTVMEPVGAGVTHVDQGQDVLAVLVDQAHRGERGPHAPQFGVVQTVLPDHGVGLGDRLGQPGPVGCRPKAEVRASTAIRAATSPPAWPPMPSATAKRVEVSTARSWLTDRTRPVSVAEPDRSRVISLPHLEDGAAHLQEVALLEAGPLADAHGVDPGAVGRAEILGPQVPVEPEQAGVQVGRVGVVVDGHAAPGRPAHRDLVADVVGPAGLVLGPDDMEAEQLALRPRAVRRPWARWRPAAVGGA